MRSLFWTFFLGSLASTTTSHRRPPRADDTNPLEVVVSKLSQDVAQLQAELQAVKSNAAKKAAFRGYLPGPDVTVNSPIRWGVSSQIGDHYDATLGVYTVPFTGYYTVHFQLYLSVQGDFHFDLHVNNVKTARARCHYAVAVTCASGLTTRLFAGDRVWLQSESPGPYYDSAMDNIFSIALVVPDN